MSTLDQCIAFTRANPSVKRVWVDGDVIERLYNDLWERDKRLPEVRDGWVLSIRGLKVIPRWTKQAAV